MFRLEHPLLYVTFSVNPSVRPSVHPSVWLFDLYLWYTCVCKRIISPGVFFFFFIFSKFLLSELLGGYKGKKWPKTAKSFVCGTLYLKKHTPYDHDFWYTWKMMISPGGFFHFFKILIFGFFREVKGQKITQNEKIPSYIIWLWFLVHMCKMISPAFFFHFFKILIFWGFRGVTGQKMTQNCQFESDFSKIFDTQV